MTAYESVYHVKTVILYTFPYTFNGVTLSAIGGTSLDGVATLTSYFDAIVKSVPNGAQIPVAGSWSYPATIVNSTLATEAVSILFEGLSDSYPIACFINYDDGRKHLEFYLDQADWALYPIILSNTWLEWVTNGVFAGVRRISLNAHMDDIFMATGVFNITIHDEDEENTYRLTPADLADIVAWQQDFNTRLPAGSTFALTFPFNGATVVQDNGGYNVDPLFIYAKSVKEHFHWESHTWSHPYLDNLTYAEVLEEFTKNVATAMALFDTDLTDPAYDNTSCITPSISGLFNGNALKAMYDVGIRNVVGDNSRPELIPANIYHGIHTSVAIHGFDGIFIVPRHATEIYYDDGLPEDEMLQYNYRYASYWGRDLTFDEMIAEQVDTHTISLLGYRQDPFMFHQENLRSFQYNNKTTSLVSFWADALVENLMKYSTLPFKSQKHSALAQIWLDREARDACGFEATLIVDSTTHAAAAINATSTGNCKFGITGVMAPESSIVSMEAYGPENTMWLQMQAGVDVEVVFNGPVPQF